MLQAFEELADWALLSTLCDDSNLHICISVIKYRTVARNSSIGRLYVCAGAWQSESLIKAKNFTDL